MTRRWFWLWAALAPLVGGVLAGSQALASKQTAECNCCCERACPPGCAEDCPPDCCSDCRRDK